MISELIQILIMLMGAAALGALVCRTCYCAQCTKKCPSCNTCDAGTCAMNASCPKKCDCGSPTKAKPLAAAATAVANAAASMKRADDLVIIEGIGPAINKILNAHGVHTFADVVTTPKEKIQEWLSEAGPQFKMHDAATWAEQAALARDGKMAELEALKVKLNNGQHA